MTLGTLGTRLIGIGGPARSGKDTVAGIICGLRAAPPLRCEDSAGAGGGDWLALKIHADALYPTGLATALADPIKQVARAVWGFSVEQLWTGENGEKDAPDPRFPRADGTCLSPREALQHLGTEVGRALYAGTWVDLLLRNLRALEARGALPPVVVVPDVRFADEVEAIRALGGRVVRLEGRGAAVRAHASERGIDAEVLWNGGDVASLRERVRAWVG